MILSGLILVCYKLTVVDSMSNKSEYVLPKHAVMCWIPLL